LPFICASDTSLSSKEDTAKGSLSAHFVQLAAERQFKVVDVPADGNCGLHAIAHQLSSFQGLAVDHKSLRHKAVCYLRTHPQLLDESFLLRKDYSNVDSYLTRHAQDGQWVDEIMMRAVGACLQRKIKILHDNGHETVLDLEILEAHKPVSDPSITAHALHVGLISESHYVSLLKMEHCQDLQKEPSTGAHINNEEQSWPSVWSEQMFHEKLEKYPFLMVNNGQLGCKSCRAVSNLQAFSGQGIHLSAEWISCQVVASGKGRQEKLSSLRKKIFLHSKSAAHVRAETIRSEKEKEKMEKMVNKMETEDRHLTSKAFRTAYYLAKKNRPFADYHDLLELQEANGSTFGIGLKSRYSATEIITHVAKEMRQRACKKIIESGSSFSVLIDESTTISNKSTLIVYLKCIVKPDAEPSFMFMDLLELIDQKAETITQALLKCLHSYGFTDDYMQTHLIAFASDGASVMTGRHSGVAAQLVTKFPNIVTWHCLNHRLELAVGDAANETQGLSHFQSFMDSIYSLYSRSPKTQKQLERAAKELSIELRKIGRVLGTRWVASSFRTVDAMWTDFEPIAAHWESAFNRASPLYDGSLASKYRGLRKKLCSPQFVLDLALMHDTLCELKMLSQQLQDRTTSIPGAEKLIRRSIRRIEHMKDKPGEKMSEAAAIAESSQFGATKLESNVKHIPINAKQFLTSVANNLRRRLLVSDGDSDEKKQASNSVLNQLTVMDSTFWPSVMDIDYGEDAIKDLCRRFQLPFASIRDGYCDYKDSGGRQITQKLKPLVQAISTIPCSTAECERGFSCMNLIMTDLRSTLLIDHVASLMFINIHGPPVSQWNPQTYVNSWTVRHRDATDTRTRVAVKPGERAMEHPDPLWDIL